MGGYPGPPTSTLGGRVVSGVVLHPNVSCCLGWLRSSMSLSRVKHQLGMEKRSQTLSFTYETNSSSFSENYEFFRGDDDFSWSLPRVRQLEGNSFPSGVCHMARGDDCA